jgi:hypothetical protein
VKLFTFWNDFSLFFLWGMEAWTLPPFFILGLLSLASVVVAWFVRRAQIRADWRSSYWLVFTQLLFYPLAIVVGVAFRVDTNGPRSPHPDPLGEHLLSAIVVASLVTAALWVYRMKGIRWLAGSLVLLQEIVLFGAFLVTRMSVTGDWI